MSTDEQAPEAAGTPTPEPTPEPTDDAPAREPNWWHRDHPVFTPLAGFFTGLLFICLIPTVFAGVVSAVAGADRVEDLFPFVLVTLAVPLALLVPEKSRRFGLYMWIGIVSTAVVVVGVGALVLWFMVSHGS